jgi:DNA-binding response OmpR family regulator
VNVLVIEDEVKIASFIKRGFEAEGFAVTTASDGVEGLAAAGTRRFDLVILDLILPSMRGEEVLATLRKRGLETPVIVLTAKDAVSDRVATLNAGADDYVTKPFSLTELIARSRARLRAVNQAVSTMISRGGIELDLRSRQVRIDGRFVQLTAREFALLETFMRHAGQVLSQPQLLDQVWGFDYDPSSNLVEVYVGNLRRKLRPDVIETVRRVGYRFPASASEMTE